MSDPPPMDDAIVTWLTSCQGPLFGFLRGIIGDSETARDLMQDVFVRTWQYVRARKAPFDHERPLEEQRRWLFHVAYTHAISERRHQHVVRWETLASVQHEVTDESLEQQVLDQEAVHAALTLLTPQDAAIVLLMVLNCFTAAEVGEILGISSAAAAKRFTRAKHKLRMLYHEQIASSPKESLP